jgi:hypothetical protein
VSGLTFPNAVFAVLVELGYWVLKQTATIPVHARCGGVVDPHQ